MYFIVFVARAIPQYLNLQTPCFHVLVWNIENTYKSSDQCIVSCMKMMIMFCIMCTFSRNVCRRSYLIILKYYKNNVEQYCPDLCDVAWKKHVTFRCFYLHFILSIIKSMSNCLWKYFFFANLKALDNPSLSPMKKNMSSFVFGQMSEDFISFCQLFQNARPLTIHLYSCVSNGPLVD